MASNQVPRHPALPTVEHLPPPSLEDTSGHADQTPCYERRKLRKRSRRDHAKKRPRGPGGKFLAKDKARSDQLPIPRTTNTESSRQVGEEGRDQAYNGKDDEDKVKTSGSTRAYTEAEKPPRITMAMTSSFNGEMELEALFQIDMWAQGLTPSGPEFEYQYREAFLQLERNLKQKI